jgi:hypothetical protein
MTEKMSPRFLEAKLEDGQLESDDRFIGRYEYSMAYGTLV